MSAAVTVLGAGGHAKVVLSTLQAAGVEVAAVHDDDAARHGSRLLDVPIVGSIHDFLRAPAPAIAAVGDNNVRRELDLQPVPWASVVHPTAWVHTDVSIGPGAVVMAGAVVQPGVTVGRHVIVNTGATVDHDCVLSDYAHVGPGVHLSGATRVGKGAFLGTGSATRQGIHVAAWSSVGVGAAVVDDVAEGATVVGVPARPLRTAGTVRPADP